MNFGFARKTSLKTLKPVNEASLSGLITTIQNDYDIVYTYNVNQNEILLKPRFQFNFMRNSFWPEVKGKISNHASHTILSITCRPTKFIYYFLAFYIGFAALMEVACIFSFFTNGIEYNIPLIIPLILCVFAYLLTAIGSAVCSRRVISLIEKAFL